jgi:hypothetical protein
LACLLFTLALIASAGLPAIRTHAAPDLQMDAPMVALPLRQPAPAGSTVVIPVTFDPMGKEVVSTAFSIDYDPGCLAFDPADANRDGRPDAVTVYAPPAYFAWIFFNADDADGEIDVALADLMPPMVRLAPGTLIEIAFRVVCSPPPPATERETEIRFSTDPAPSYGDPIGKSLAAGPAQHGSVLIGLPVPVPTNTPTQTPAPGPTATSTAAPTSTPTGLLTPAPTETPTPSPTATEEEPGQASRDRLYLSLLLGVTH